MSKNDILHVFETWQKDFPKNVRGRKVIEKLLHFRISSFARVKISISICQQVAVSRYVYEGIARAKQNIFTLYGSQSLSE